MSRAKAPHACKGMRFAKKSQGIVTNGRLQPKLSATAIYRTLVIEVIRELNAPAVGSPDG